MLGRAMCFGIQTRFELHALEQAEGKFRPQYRPYCPIQIRFRKRTPADAVDERLPKYLVVEVIKCMSTPDSTALQAAASGVATT